MTQNDNRPTLYGFKGFYVGFTALCRLLRLRFLMSGSVSEIRIIHRQALLTWLATLTDYVHSDRPDLTNRHMAVILVVYVLPGPHTVRGLAATLRVAKPVVTRALNTLSDLGLLRRQKDENDLRSIFVEQTPQGLSFIKDFADLIERN